MQIVYWIVVGALAGWIASMVMKTNAQMGAVGNIVVGIVGAIVGGWLLGALFSIHSSSFLGNVLTAIVGAVVVLWVWKLVSGRGAAGPTAGV